MASPRAPKFDAAHCSPALELDDFREAGPGGALTRNRRIKPRLLLSLIARIWYRVVHSPHDQLLTETTVLADAGGARRHEQAFLG